MQYLSPAMFSSQTQMLIFQVSESDQVELMLLLYDLEVIVL